MRFAQEISIFNPHAIEMAVVALGTRITQTAEEIRLEAAQTLSNYSTTVQMNAAISTKANEITSEVSETYATIQSLNSNVSSLSSRITQNANSISSEVTNRQNADSSLSSRITQNANSISSEVTARQNGDSSLSSRITQTLKSISFNISNNSTNTAATLSMSVTNEGGSTTALTSKTINLTGLVKFTDLSTSGSTTINGANIQTGTLSASKITTGTLSGDRINGGTITGSTISGGTLIATGTSANDITIGGGKIKVPWIEFYTQAGNFAASWTVDNSTSNGNSGYHRLWCGYGIRLSGNSSTWNWIENPSIIDANTYFKAGVFDQNNNLQFTSDRRKKQNITYLDIDAAANRVMALKAARFEFKATPNVIHHGFIAQDVQGVIDDGWDVVESYTDPDEKEERLSLKYTELIADLVATAQSQDKRIKALEAKHG